MSTVSAPLLSLLYVRIEIYRSAQVRELLSNKSLFFGQL